VLRDDGSLWIVIGDSYATSPAGNTTPSGFSQNTRKRLSAGLQSYNSSKKRGEGLKSKDLVGAPWSLALALRKRGWYLRSEIIWAKTNTTPESVTDRPTKCHETIFLLTKRPDYYYDSVAIMEGAVSVGDRRKGKGRHEYGGKYGKDAFVVISENGTRNARDVWTVSTEPFQGDHFAIFPKALVKPMVMAGTSELGCCSKCGAPWRREVERESMVIDRSLRTHPMGHTRPSGKMLSPPKATTLGWSPSCSCSDVGIVPCTVLDCFGGTGTTAIVANALGRSAVLIEANAEYCGIAKDRIDREVESYKAKCSAEDAWGNSIIREELEAAE
jgi:DNA methylase